MLSMPAIKLLMARLKLIAHKLKVSRLYVIKFRLINVPF